MKILSDSTETKTLHTRVIHLYDAPSLLTHSFYGPKGETYQPSWLTITWYEGDAPQTVDIEGTTDRGAPITRGFGWNQMPTWMREVVDGKAKADPEENR